MFRTLISTSW